MDDGADGVIRISRDGPYEVTNGIPLNQASIACDNGGEAVSWEKGKTYDTGSGETYRLCRCGQSRDKPFCDGTHEDAGFCGRESADRRTYEESARVIWGEGVDLMDDASLCVGARFCGRHGGIWNLMDNAGDPETRRKILGEAHNCPSGRLVVVDKNGVPVEPDLPREITLIEDPAFGCRGPLWVRGGIGIEGAGGEVYQARNRVALCRCGNSENMPFCDASHYDCEQMKGLDE